MVFFPTLTCQKKKTTQSSVSVPTKMMTATLSSARIVRPGNTLNVTIPAGMFQSSISAQIVGQDLWTEKEQQNVKSACENSLTVVTGNRNGLLRLKAATKRKPSPPLPYSSRPTAGTSMNDTTRVRLRETSPLRQSDQRQATMP